MTQPNTTRRALLGAATTALAYAGGAAIVGGAAVVASEAKGATRLVDRTAWNAAVAELKAARHAAHHFGETVEDPTRKHIEAIAPHPGHHFEVPATNGQIGKLRWYPEHPDAYDEHGASIRNAARAHRAKYEAWRAAADRMDLSGINDRSNELGELRAEAEDRLFETPAPDLAAVIIKLDILWNEQKGEIPDYNALVLADVRRLAGEAQA